MMAIGWGALAVFLACMVALGLGSHDVRVVILAALMSLVCWWAFARHERRERRAVSPYFERGER